MNTSGGSMSIIAAYACSGGAWGAPRHGFANLCQSSYPCSMSTMNISLPDSLRSFVEDQVSTRGYATSSEYVRELIRKDLDRQHLRGLLLDGASTEPTAPADADYFEALRDRSRKGR